MTRLPLEAMAIGRRFLTVLSLLAAVVGSGCVAKVGVGDAKTPSTGTPPGCNPQVGPTPMLRLTRAQYDNAAADLLQAHFQPSSALSSDEKVGPFASNGQALMSSGLAEQYQFVAEQLGAEVEANVQAQAPCADPTHGGAACAAHFIDLFGRRAFRRPLAADETARWNAVFQAAAADSYAWGIRTVVEAMLQSPSFLYRVEALPPGVSPDAGAPYAVDAFAEASRLSFLLWNSGPDDTLLDAAAAGKLATPEGRAAQVERMSQDPKRRRAMDAFAGGWAELDQLAAAASTPARLGPLDPSLVPMMRAETVDFLEDVLFKGDGKFSTLLTAGYSVANPALAKAVYGATGPADASGHIPLPPGQRSGILTQASLLFTHSHAQITSPTLRGKWVRQVLFCQDVPAPPPNVNASPPIPQPGQTMRQRLAAHRTDPSCSGCHALMDNIGLGFENYDQFGQYRTQEIGLPVDSSGNLVGSDVDGNFANFAALTSKLTASQEVNNCFTRQWFRFGLGRAETQGEACSLTGMSEAMSTGGYPAFVKALVQSPSFQMRSSP